MLTLRQALQQGAAQLAQASASPRLDAEVLLAHLLGSSRATLLADGERQLDLEQAHAYNALIARRAALEPVAYIIGHKEFYGFDFVVDQRVLVPRPETELVVDLARAWWARKSPLSLTIADIGTGSGCLAVTLALLLPEAHVYAVDLSLDALDVAQLNAQRHDVAHRITFLRGSGCEPVPQPVALVVSNPPYTVLADVDENVRRWEPQLALDGGAEEGFAIPAQIMRQAPAYLQPGGLLLMEIGAWQGTAARELAQRVFPHGQVRLYPDLARLDRVVAVET